MTVRLTKLNEVFVHVSADNGVLREISDRFSFKVPGHQYMPKFRSGIWDGTARLFNLKNQKLHIGLVSELVEFCELNDYELSLDPKLINQRQITREDVDLFVSKLRIPKHIEPREYQLDSVHKALNRRRIGLLSPTSSGKSLIIYVITQFILKTGGDVLIIVPTTQLVSQMNSDFTEYNNGVPLDTHEIMAGVDKAIMKRVTISTWQSLYKLDQKWFERFDAVIGDEAHLYKAVSLVSILEKCVNTADRFAFTGTLDGSNVNKLQIEGLFGKFHVVTTTDQLMKDGHVSTLDVRCAVLKYSKEECNQMKADKDYNNEINYINSHAKRNAFIVNLVRSLKGNTLVLFKRVDTHGVLLYKMIAAALEGKAQVYFVAGGVATEEREAIRKLIDNNKSALPIVIVGSMGTMSTGTNMKKLQNLVFVSPTKSRITTLQSVGRGLRLDGIDNKVTLYDICDDFRIGSYVNHTMKHFFERVKMYDAEKFNYKVYTYEV